MKEIRNHRRIVGAIVLTLLCFVATASPAAAFDREDASFEGRVFIRVSVLWDRVQSAAASLLSEIGDSWLDKTGARVED